MINHEQELQALIADLQVLILKYNKVTRDFYRERGAFPERIWNKHFSTFKAFKEAAGSAPEQQTEQTHTYTDNGDVWDISLPKTHIRSVDELVELYKIDRSVWEVERFTVGSHEMGMKPPATTEYIETKDGRKIPAWVRTEKEPVIVPLHNVKATFVRKKQIVAIKAEIEALKEDAKNFARIPETVVRTATQSGNVLELLIPDLHAGKFAWGKETLHPDYDTPTAIKTYLTAVEEIIDRAKGYKFDRIVLGVGNDLLNSDDYNSQTTKGTLVNSDTRYQKTYKSVREMLVQVIERLRLIAPVTVKVVPGNHDTQTTFTLGDSLECWFHNYNDVEIDNAPSPHKFFRWGNVLLGFTHGDKGKKADYGLWMATERPKDFGETKYREIHIGHTHGVHVDEKFGVRVRTFAALCPPDAWHSAEHFVGNLRQAEGLVWNAEKGRIAEFIYTEPEA